MVAAVFALLQLILALLLEQAVVRLALLVIALLQVDVALLQVILAFGIVAVEPGDIESLGVTVG